MSKKVIQNQIKSLTTSYISQTQIQFVSSLVMLVKNTEHVSNYFLIFTYFMKTRTAAGRRIAAGQRSFDCICVRLALFSSFVGAVRNVVITCNRNRLNIKLPTACGSKQRTTYKIYRCLKNKKMHDYNLYLQQSNV